MVENFRNSNGASHSTSGDGGRVDIDRELAAIIENHIAISERKIEFEKNDEAQQRLNIAIKHLTWTRVFVDQLDQLPQGSLGKTRTNVSRRLRIAVARVHRAIENEDAIVCCRGSRSILIQIARMATLGSLAENKDLIEESKCLLQVAVDRLKNPENWRHISNIRLRLQSIFQLESFMEGHDESAKLLFSERILRSLPEAIASLKQDLGLINPLAI